MPDPKNYDNKTEFLKVCIPTVIDEGKDRDQAVAQCNSMWDDKNTKETKVQVCLRGLQKKEENGVTKYTGLIATTHPDRVGDILSSKVMYQIADYINDTSRAGTDRGAFRSVSLFHDWVKEGNPELDEAGWLEPTARVIDLDNGHKGVEVDYVVNQKYHGPMDAEEIVYRIDNGNIAGFSIEYDTDSGNTRNVDYEGKTYRFIDTLSEFAGVGLARARKIANPYAVIYKEIAERIDSKEASTMDYEKLKKKMDAGEELSSEEKEFMKKKKAEMEKKEAEEESSEPVEAKEEETTEVKEEENSSEEPETKEEESEPVKEEEKSEPETKEIDVKEVVEKITQTPEYKNAINSIEVKSKVKVSEQNDAPSLSIKEMNVALKEIDYKRDDPLTPNKTVLSFKEAANDFLMENPDFALKELQKPENFVGFRSNLQYKTVGKGLQIKGTLGTGDNASDFTQADVEFADLFAPGIIDTFNNQTNLFGFLKKEQHPGGEHYQWKMVTNKDPDSNDTFVGANDTSIVKNYSSKKNYQTPLKIARRGISVTDFIRRYSARTFGDLFQMEVDLQMKEKMNVVDAALFAEVADGDGLAPLGLEAVADSEGNTTLYGLSRSTANRLSPDTASNTYEAIGGSITEAKLRLKIEYLKSEGSMPQNLAIIAHPTTAGYIKNLLDGNRRFLTTKAEFGFSQMEVATFDGLPIIEDHNCNNDALYIIDREEDVIVIGMAPQLIGLAKVGAATEAYVQMDFAHVYKQPRRISMLDTLSGPAS